MFQLSKSQDSEGRAEKKAQCETYQRHFFYYYFVLSQSDLLVFAHLYQQLYQWREGGGKGQLYQWREGGEKRAKSRACRTGQREEEESRVGGVGNSLGAGVGWGSPTPQRGNCYWCTRAVNSEREDETVWLVL